jgi:hypothetical protein
LRKKSQASASLNLGGSAIDNLRLDHIRGLDAFDYSNPDRHLLIDS